MLGHEKEKLIGKPFIKYFHPENQHQISMMLEGIKKETQIVTKARLKHKEGHYIHGKCNGKGFINEEKDLNMFPIIQNITAQKKAEESEKKFREAYKKPTFYKDLFAHDIRNILSVIKGTTDLCSINLENLPKKEKLKEHSAVIKQ